AVSKDGVKALRIGMNGQVPPTTRVVVDLDGSRQPELIAGKDGHFTLKVQDAAIAMKAAAPVVMPVAASSAPKLTPASATIATAAPAPVAAAPSVKPADFAFVEPDYTAKKDDKVPPVQPVVKAQDAAARFADKTAAELVATNAHAEMRQDAGGNPIQPAVNMAAEQKAQLAQNSANNGPKYTGEPISVNLKDVDLKDFFRLIHEISGLNVVLDPTVRGTLTIVLDDVPWDQAL